MFKSALFDTREKGLKREMTSFVFVLFLSCKKERKKERRGDAQEGVKPVIFQHWKCKAFDVK